MKLRANITTDDIKCNCGCGFDKISPAVLDVVQDAREHFGRPAHINSGNHCACRCYKHNISVGGSKTSKHLPDGINSMCRAVDFHIEDIAPAELNEYLVDKYPNCLGIGLYNTFVHIDDKMAKARRWNNSTNKTKG